jgi:AraC-like DNA-binding protein
MIFDYGSECTPLLSCIQLRSGQVKLFNLLLKLDQWQNAEAIPLNRPKQHVVCLHHFERSMKFDRNLGGRTRRETTAKGDIAFIPELGSISQAAGLSKFHFARLFKAATGITPFQFVTGTRMERAKQLLRKTRLPIFEIAERVGYQKPSHFSARFQAVFGCGPNDDRRSAGD